MARAVVIWRDASLLKMSMTSWPATGWPAMKMYVPGASVVSGSLTADPNVM